LSWWGRERKIAIVIFTELIQAAQKAIHNFPLIGLQTATTGLIRTKKIHTFIHLFNIFLFIDFLREIPCCTIHILFGCLFCSFQPQKKLLPLVPAGFFARWREVFSALR
jgi:hypothetical protein